MAKGINTAGHPGRQVGRSSWSAAMDARTREYSDVRSGAMSHEDARRVGINPAKVTPEPQQFSISPRLASFENRLRGAGH